MFDYDGKSCIATYTEKMITKIVSSKDEATLKAIERYCEENNITYIDMYNELTDDDGNFNKKYTYDGLHPNTLGYAKVTRVLMPYIFENVNIEEK